MSMASSLLYKNLLKQLEDQLRCHICSEFYDKCVMAACSHNFCSACIKKRLATESDCPNCFEEIEENDLRRNKMLDTLVRFYKKIQSQIYPLERSLLDSDVNYYSTDAEGATKRIKLDSGAISDVVVTSDVQVVRCASCSSLHGVFKEISKKLDDVLLNIEAINRKQSASEEDQNEMRQALKTIVDRLDISAEKIEVKNLPLEDELSLKELEVLLDSHEEFRKHVKYLGRLGGRDVNDVTRRVMFSLITNQFACKINWAGTNGKVGLKSYPRFLQLILASVRDTPATKGCKQREVEEVVKRWYRTAPDRDGGRSKRKRPARSIHKLH